MSSHSCLEDGSENKDSDSDNGTVVKRIHGVTKHSMQILQQCFIKQGFIDVHHAALDAAGVPRKFVS